MDHAFGLDIPSTLDEVCDPSRAALIVYDMQVGVVSQLATGQVTVERVRQVLQAARARGGRRLPLFLPPPYVSAERSGRREPVAACEGMARRGPRGRHQAGLSPRLAAVSDHSRTGAPSQ